MTPPPTDPTALVDRVVRLMKVLIVTQDAGAIEQVNILAECADTIERLESYKVVSEDIMGRGEDAHAYAQTYLMPGAWGKNVWHAILDDAVAQRATIERLEQVITDLLAELDVSR